MIIKINVGGAKVYYNFILSQNIRLALRKLMLGRKLSDEITNFNFGNGSSRVIHDVSLLTGRSS